VLFAAAGGDDYELLVTLPAGLEQSGREPVPLTGVPVVRIGRVTPVPGLRLTRAGNQVSIPGYDHFR
jgi:thiamine-monophosphate kinase